jgi:hypothetical protein
MTDEWHRKLAQDFGAAAATAAALDGATLLEIAFGRARSVVAYALELALAHRLPATGSVAGDDIWLRLGDARVRFTMNRREGFVLVSRWMVDDLRARWDEPARAVVELGADGASGAVVDLEAMARASIDGIVADWRARPLPARALSARPPSFEDEPTKG